MEHLCLQQGRWFLAFWPLLVQLVWPPLLFSLPLFEALVMQVFVREVLLALQLLKWLEVPQPQVWLLE